MVYKNSSTEFRTTLTSTIKSRWVHFSQKLDPFGGRSLYHHQTLSQTKAIK